MKKLLISIAVLLSLTVGKAVADEVHVATPQNQFGVEADMKYSGAKVAVIVSSGTTGTETLLTSKACVVFGVLASSAVANGSYLVLYDTATVGAGTQYLPTINFEVNTKSYSILFDPPVRFSKGVTYKFTHASGGPNGVSILYLEK